MWCHLLNGLVYILALCQLYRIWLYTGLALCKSIRSPAIHRASPVYSQMRYKWHRASPVYSLVLTLNYPRLRCLRLLVGPSWILTENNTSGFLCFPWKFLRKTANLHVNLPWIFTKDNTTLLRKPQPHSSTAQPIQYTRSADSHTVRSAKQDQPFTSDNTI